MTKLYRCSGAIQFHAAVEADSLAEATRIIDGVLNGAEEVIIREGGGPEDGGDELVASKGTVTRSRIQVEH